MKQEENQEEKILKTVNYLYECGLSEDPFIGQLLQDAHITGDFSEVLHHLEKNQEQVESLNRRNAVKEYLVKQFPFYPLPNGEELEKLSGPLKMGIINSIKGVLAFFGLDPNILTMHTMVAGRTGTGKSWFNTYMLIQLVALSLKLGFNIIVPDVKRFYRRLLCKVPGLKIITFDKLIMNFLEVPKRMDPRYFIMLFSRKFVADNVLGGTSERLISLALSILFKEKGILDGGVNYPHIAELLATIVKLQGDRSFGPHFRDIIVTVIGRLSQYAFLEKNFCVRKGIPIEVFTQENVIIELPLDMVSEYIHNFIVSWIASLIFARNMILGLRGNQLRIFFLVDEARTLLSAPRERSSFEWIEPGFNEIIAKGREFGVGLWLCSQETRSFSQIFRSNCLLKICFPLTDGEDVQEIRKSFGLNDEQTDYLFKLPEQRVAVCRYGRFERPFILVVPELN